MASSSSPSKPPSFSRPRFRLIVGPMCAGKTTALLHAASREHAIGRRILLVNHAFDTRFGTSNMATHAGAQADKPYDQISVHSLEQLLPISAEKARLSRHQALVLDNYDCVCIDELQFYKDDPTTVIEYFVEILRKEVIAAGLVADYRREPFGHVLPLIAKADTVEHCRGLCSVCGAPGCFTQKKTKASAGGVLDVGGVETYTLVCREHYQQDLLFF